MYDNTEILMNLIDEDFGLITKQGSKWAKSEEHDSLVLDLEKGIFYWNSKDVKGNALTYLTKVRNLNLNDAKDLLSKLEFTKSIATVKSNKGVSVVIQPKLLDVFYNNGLHDRQYFYDRGLTDKTINMFSLGKFSDFYVVPFLDNGNLKNFQLRRDNKDNTKTIKGYYKDIGPLIFNPDILKLVDRVFYTEGPVDAMILIQNGLPAVSTNCGGGYLPQWYSKFIKQKEIILLFDNDEAGSKESKKLANFLGQTRTKIYLFNEFNKKGYDPVDFFRDGYGKEELLNLIKEKAKYVFQI